MTSGSISIGANDGASVISVQTDATLGSVQITGGISFKGIPSSAVTLSSGQGATFNAPSPQSTIDELTIAWTGGTVNLIVGF